jgi:zinc protease
LALVGDIDIPQTKALIEAYFGDIPAGAPVAAALDVYPPPAEFPVTRTDATSGCAIGHEETLIDPRAELPSALAAVVGPGPGQPDYYALGVLANILATGDSSRLSQNILDEGLASSIWAGHMDDGLKTSEFIAQIIPNAGDEVTGAADLLRAEFANVRAEGVTEAELQRAKNQIQLNMVTGFRDSAFETTEWLQWFARVYGDPDQLEQELAGYLAVTAEDVQRVAQTYLCDRPMSWITVLQEGEAVTSEYPGALVEPVEVSPDPLDGLPDGVVSRTSPPTALPDVDMALAPFTSFELDNGLDVIFVAQTKTPQLTAALYVGSSDAALPADQQGLAALLADLLTKGTDTRAADEISAAIEDIGGEVAAEANTEYIVVQASGPATARTVIFDTLADITLNPTFPATEFAIAQEQQLSNLEFVASDPDTLAWQQYQRIAFPGHPYGLYATPETVTALAPDDLADFHTAHFVPDNAVLVIAGDLTADEAQAEAERAFGDWAGDAPAAVEYPEAAAGDTSAIYLIDLPDAEQATILAGNRSASVNDPDRFALYVANHILGGTFNSRLNYNLREEHGYTYGVYSSVDPLRAPGYFYIYGSVGQDVAGPALAEVLYELDRLQTAPIPDEELADAQSYLISSYLMRNADMDTYARTLGYTAISGLDPETVNAVVDNYAAVSAADAQAAARRYIEAEQPVIVVAASAAAVQAQLEELGEVVVVDAEGNPLE